MRTLRYPLLNSIRHPVVLLTLAASCLAGAACRSTPPASEPATSADTWAVVDGREITREEVEKAFRRIGDGPQAMSDEEAMTAKLSLLEDLIVQDLLLAKAAELNLAVTEAEVDTAFAEAKANIPDDAFQQELTRRSLSAADMREGLRRELLAQKVIEQEVGSKITVTDQEVTDLFNANRAQFNLPEESYHLAQIIITPIADPQVTNRTGDDATTPQEATAKAAMVMERLKAGAAFGDLARDFSEDPESAPRGGDLGLVPVSTVKAAPPALRDAVLNRTPGTARVVSQDGGHTIVYVVAHEPAGQRELTTPGVREQITETLRARKDQLLRTAYLTALRSDAEVTNYLARRLVESQGSMPGQTSAAP